MITAELVKKLRDETSISVMQCKKALEEADGDYEKAILILKKKGAEVAAKKADREATDGLIVIRQNSEKAVVLTLSCETDFVSKNEQFVASAQTLADIALSESPSVATEKAPEILNSLIQKIGENIQLVSIEELSGSAIGSYVHNGKNAVVVSLAGGTSDLARDIAMHIAAMKPEFIESSEISSESYEQAKNLFKEEVDATDKPEEIKSKMLEGKLSTFFKERTLMDQAFIKNADITIKTLLSQNSATIEKIVRKTI